MDGVVVAKYLGWRHTETEHQNIMGMTLSFLTFKNRTLWLINMIWPELFQCSLNNLWIKVWVVLLQNWGLEIVYSIKSGVSDAKWFCKHVTLFMILGKYLLTMCLLTQPWLESGHYQTGGSNNKTHCAVFLWEHWREAWASLLSAVLGLLFGSHITKDALDKRVVRYINVYGQFSITSLSS